MTTAAAEAWFLAAAEGKTQELTRALHKGARCDWVASRDQQALHAAVTHGHEDVVWLLIGAYASQGVPLDALTQQGITALGMAIHQRSVPLVQALLAGGANPDATALQSPAGPLDAWACAARKGAVPVLRVLLDHQPQRLTQDPPPPLLPDVWTLATQGSHDAALEWLRAKGYPRHPESRPWDSALEASTLGFWCAQVGAEALLSSPEVSPSLALRLATHTSPNHRLPLEWMAAHVPAALHRLDAQGRSPLRQALEADLASAVTALSDVGASWWVGDALSAGSWLQDRWGPDAGLPEEEAAWRAACANERLGAHLPVAPARASYRRL